jgi:hypothetical protein
MIPLRWAVIVCSRLGFDRLPSDVDASLLYPLYLAAASYPSTTEVARMLRCDLGKVHELLAQ